MKLAIRTFRQILDLALIVLVVLVLGTVLAVNVAPGLGHQLIVIRGGSMEPAIHLGSTVDVVTVDARDLRAGDVVTVKGTNGVMVTHRIVRSQLVNNELWFLLKGDANKSADGAMVPASAVVGRVNGNLPYHGYLIYLLTMPTGIASVFLLAATMLLCIWLLEDLEDEEEEDEAEERAERDAQGAAVALAAGAPQPAAAPSGLETTGPAAEA